MSKLDKIRAALEKQPQLLADLLHDLKTNVPRIAGPWRHPGKGPKKTPMQDRWIRTDFSGAAVVVVQLLTEPPGWHVEQTNWPDLMAGIDALPFSETEDGAKQIADLFLESHGFSFVKAPRAPFLTPWKEMDNGHWTRSHKGKIEADIVYSVEDDVWTSSVGFSHGSLRECKKLVDSLLGKKGWLMMEKVGVGLAPEATTTTKQAGPWRHTIDEWHRHDLSGTLIARIWEINPGGHQVWQRRDPAGYVVAGVEPAVYPGRDGKWTGSRLSRGATYDTLAMVMTATDDELKLLGYELPR